MLTCQLVVFAKAPQLGRVKRRLARGIGWLAATQFYRRTTAAVLHRLAGDRRWRLSLWVTPDRAARAGRWWPAGIRRYGQGNGDLGQRMARPFRRLPPGPVVLIGSDIPAVNADHIGRAFAQLGGHDAVVGPASDGGYWLIGFGPRMRRGASFANVRWSSRHALDDTLAGLAGARVALAERLHDVDTAADYAAWRTARK